MKPHGEEWVLFSPPPTVPLGYLSEQEARNTTSEAMEWISLLRTGRVTVLITQIHTLVSICPHFLVAYLLLLRIMLPLPHVCSLVSK